VHAASEPFAARQDDVGDALVLDVRRAGIFATAPTMLPGASWRDPAAVREWAGALPTGRELIVYCVYGHEVGRATALRLRARGLNARFLEGGIDAWQSAGRATVPNTDADAQ
jgi:superoxide dismutase, Fe-Mn family